jgi:hypothetical protein
LFFFAIFMILVFFIPRLFFCLPGGLRSRKWVKRYGWEDILPKRIKVETMDEIDELQAARSRIRKLEAALADAHMEYCLESAFLDIACRNLGRSLKNHYKGRKERERREADSGLVEQLVLAQRAVQPRLGGRKLFHILGPEPAHAGVKLGRDRFFEILREKSLLSGRLAGAPGRRTRGTACRSSATG